MKIISIVIPSEAKDLGNFSFHRTGARNASPPVRDEKRKIAALFLSLALLSGCTVYHPVKNLTGTAIPESYAHYYDYPMTDPKAQILSTEETETYRLVKVEIPLVLPEEIALKNPDEFKKKIEKLAETDQKSANDQKLRYVTRIDYYVPRKLKAGQKRPAVLISPILGGNMVVDHFARYYTGRGYVAAIVHRKKLFWDDARGEDFGQIEDYLRISVIRLREVVDWLELQPEVDAGRIGAFGISYGAILHSMLAPVEPRIRFHVLAMPAGPLSDVIIDCPDAGCTKVMKHVHEKYGWSKEYIRAGLAKAIKTDPVLLAPYVDRKKILLYAAQFDRVVGAKRTYRLWRAMGKPKLRVMPFGHYGGILVFPWLQTQSYLALKKHLK